ncbi:hypothetical protein, partial [Paenibacillus odorifer]
MKEVAALVVGKSGAGKSEFIGSFSENSNLINSSGGGQTTRTSVEYNFHINNVVPYVQVNFLSEEQFIEKRMSQIQIDEIWEEVLPLESQKEEYTYDEYLLITEKIKKKVEVDSNEKAETSEVSASDSSSINNVANYKIVHIVEHLLQATFRILRDSIKDFPNKFDLMSI